MTTRLREIVESGWRKVVPEFNSRTEKDVVDAIVASIERELCMKQHDFEDSTSPDKCFDCGAPKPATEDAK